jgi:hypothetical protein
MRNSKRKAAIAALITAGAIAIGAVGGGAFSTTQARRDSKPPPWCGVICMGMEARGGSQDLALTTRKAGKGQQEYLLAIPGVRGNGQSHCPEACPRG